MRPKGKGREQGRRLRREYERALKQVEAGASAQAEQRLRQLLARGGVDTRLRALCHNDLGVLLAARGLEAEACGEFRLALEADPRCQAAQDNLRQLGWADEPAGPAAAPRPDAGRLRIALVSLLFNWVSWVAGGGCVHTAGLGKALAGDGHEVKHFYARSRESGVGEVEPSCPLPGEAVAFGPEEWHREAIEAKFREAVERFAPDLVVVTDSWNFKPHLAQAMSGYPVWLRFDSQECLCPLNNGRLLLGPSGDFRQCPYHQLAAPELCARCVRERGESSGPLHQMERQLSGVEEPAYQEVLRQALRGAQLLLVNNPLIKEALSPYAREVQVVPPGVEAARFPGDDGGGPERAPGEPAVIFMAGVAEEVWKGFPTLHEACRRLWRRRQDFRLVATGAAAGRQDEFTEFTGWLSQEELPGAYRDADICVVPSWVQDAWPTVGAEAMAAGRPLVASRIGGLQAMISPGATGLLCEPGEAEGLAACLEQLLDDPELRRRMGREARRHFEQTGSWEAVMAQHYRPLLARLTTRQSAVDRGAV